MSTKEQRRRIAITTTEGWIAWVESKAKLTAAERSRLRIFLLYIRDLLKE